MSDLISRSELLKEIEKYKFGAISNDAEREYVKTTILNFIECQPTAYDPGKVVEELEKELSLADKEKERCTGENNLQFDSAKGYASGISTAIEIVKQGGVSDDVYEWNDEKIMCKDCEHFRIEKPDECNEGHAYCLKYNLSTMLIGKQYNRKIDRLECYKHEIENAEQLKAGVKNELQQSE